MNQKRSRVSERILDLTLEIISLLTGEDYEVVKKPHAHVSPSSHPCVSGAVSLSRPLLRDGNNEKKILHLTSKIIQLLTDEGWEYEEDQHYLYKEELMENPRSRNSAGKEETKRHGESLISTPEEFPPPGDGARYPQVDPSTCIKGESESPEEGNLPDLSAHSEHPSTGIKEERTSLAGGTLSDTGPYTPTECTEDTDTFTRIKVESDACAQDPYEDVDMPTDYLCIRIKEESDSCEGDLTDPKNNTQTDNAFAFVSQDSREEIPPRGPDDKKTFSCSECGKCFSQKWNFINHQKTHTGEKPYKCVDCGKCYTQSANLSTHRKRIHTGEKPFKCTECGKCFTQATVLASHEMIHTGEKPFECPDCEKCFNQKSNLIKHQRIHTGEKPFKCGECGKCFTWATLLASHIRIHTGEKPFKCGECGKCFTQAAHLASHKLIHTGEKTFKCSECGKCFIQKSNLVKHQTIHTGEKPFKCSECGKCFNQKFNLAKHQTIHTGDRPFKCSDCGKTFSRPMQLATHKRIHVAETPKGRSQELSTSS